MRDGLRDARDSVCFIDGTAFASQRRKSTISFVDFKGKGKICAKSFKRRVELLSHLEALSLPTDGTVRVLHQRLKDHLGAISKCTDPAEHVQIHPNRLSRPSAICAANNDLLFVQWWRESICLSGNINIWWSDHPRQCYEIHCLSIQHRRPFFYKATWPMRIFLRSLEPKLVLQIRT